MTHDNIKLTRCEMQTEALIIESLLNAAMAMNASLDPAEAFDLIEMAQQRANRLNIALDSVNIKDAMQ